MPFNGQSLDTESRFSAKYQESGFWSWKGGVLLIFTLQNVPVGEVEFPYVLGASTVIDNRQGSKGADPWL
jgi:hypothetical protein